MLRVSNLSYKYKSGPQILKNVSFELEGGVCMGVLGNNGAGKSTMLKCLNRILHAKSGEVWLDDKMLLNLPQREIAKKVAFVSQSVPSTQMTVHDMVMLGRRPYMSWGFSEQDHKIAHECMEKLCIEHLRGRYLNELSGGERQKVMLARALAQQPKLLLLDEPTSSLDIKNQYQVLEIVRDFCDNLGIAAMAVLHDINLALRFCDKLLLLKDGKATGYGGRDILDRETLKDVYDVSAEIRDVQHCKLLVVD